MDPALQSMFELSQGDLADEEILKYFEELTSYGLERLRREPEKLEDDAIKIQSLLEKLAFKEYKAFIKSAECSVGTRKEFYEVQGHLDGLLEKIPKMKEASEKFLETVANITSEQKANSQILQQHSQIIELLEIPQLLDTCVRNQYYEEALELEAHVQRLRNRLEYLPIIQNISKEVSLHMQLMMEELIQVLSTDIKLPVCLKTVGYIRRMQAFSEIELRIVFLQARDVFLKASQQAIPTADTFTFMKTYIEVCREKFFDIITQYRAVFPDNLKEHKHQGNTVLYDWIVQKVAEFLHVLESNLSRIADGASLNTLLNQCMYFGMSLGRIGVDFRGLLCQMFENAVFELVNRVVSGGTLAFIEGIKAYRWLLPQTPSAPFASGAIEESPTPPAVLIDYSPIAILCNSYITAFNELRQCAPLELIQPLSEHIKHSLRQATQELNNYSASNRNKFKQQEREAFDDFCRVLGEVFVPFVVRCLQAIYPTHADEIFTLLDTKAVNEPILPFYENLRPKASFLSVPKESSQASTPVTESAPASPLTTTGNANGIENS